ncbi:MAG: hypothetical protein ABI390_12155, partial [Daejeonella sp.]
LFVALGATTASAQYSSKSTQTTRRVTEPGVYQDERGEYQWQTVEHRVWIPQRRTAGIFGIGSRTIPGHYEMRTDRVKVYRRDRNSVNSGKRKGWEGKHPHGMPPGQRKKLENRNNDRYDYYDNRSKGKSKSKKHDRDDD